MGRSETSVVLHSDHTVLALTGGDFELATVLAAAFDLDIPRLIDLQTLEFRHALGTSEESA